MSKINIDTDKVVNRIYHIDELKLIIDQIIKDYVEQVVLMSDDELKEDRSEWIKRLGREGEDEILGMTFDVSIHTLAIEIEQLRRYKKIVYVEPDELRE